MVDIRSLPIPLRTKFKYLFLAELDADEPNAVKKNVVALARSAFEKLGEDGRTSFTAVVGEDLSAIESTLNVFDYTTYLILNSVSQQNHKAKKKNLGDNKTKKDELLQVINKAVSLFL